MVNDNDVNVSLTRTNSFGETAHGEVYETATGNGWSFSWTFRLAIDRDENFYVRVDHLVIRPIR